MSTLFALFLGLFVIGLICRYRQIQDLYAAESQKAVQEQGQKLRSQLDGMYAGPHEYRAVDLRDFPYLDAHFYELGSEMLEARGFRVLGEVEDLTASEVIPKLRTCQRILVSHDGQLCATLTHLHPLGWMRWLQRLRLLPQNMKLVEFVQEFTDGRFLTTATTKELDTMEMPEVVMLERMSIRTHPTRALERHQERLHALQQSSDDFVPRTFRTLDDVIAAMKRATGLLAQHREEIGGGMTRQELEGAAGKKLSAREEELLEEVNQER